jgi:hypothetical protein
MSTGSMEEDHAYCSICDVDSRGLQPSSIDDVFASFQQPEQAEKSYQTWKGWSIGNYVLLNHYLPLHDEGSCCWQPFLIVDIIKIRQVGVRFVVAYIFSEDTAKIYAAAKFRKENSISRKTVGSNKSRIGSWPSRAGTERPSYALSNYFELFCDAEKAWIWPQTYRFVADGWIFDITTASITRAQIPDTSSIGHALGHSLEFHPFLKLPRELRDTVYEFALSDGSRSHEIDVATLIKRWQQRSIPTSCYNRFNPVKRAHHVQTSALLWTSRQLANESWDTLCRIMTLVLNDDLFILAREQYVVLTRLPRLRVSKQLEVVDGGLPDLSDQFEDVQRALRDWHHVRHIQMCIEVHDVTDRSILGKGSWSPWDAQRLALDSSGACLKLTSYLSNALGIQRVSWGKIETGCERWMSRNLGQHQACGECLQMYAESVCSCASASDIVQASPYARCSMCISRR